MCIKMVVICIYFVEIEGGLLKDVLIVIKIDMNII